MLVERFIREIDEAELDALLALYRHLHERDDPPPERALLVESWRQLCADPAHIYMGGYVDGELVAACNAAVVPNLTRGGRPYAVIENVVTHAAHRRRGHGAAVLRTLVERCRAANCYKVMLMSAMTRAAQHAFYDAIGFDRHAKQAFVLDLR